MKAKFKMLSVLFVMLFTVAGFSQSMNKMHSMKKDSAKTMHHMKTQKKNMMKAEKSMTKKGEMVHNKIMRHSNKKVDNKKMMMEKESKMKSGKNMMQNKMMKSSRTKGEMNRHDSTKSMHKMKK